MTDLKISKSELVSLLNKAICRLKDNTLPGEVVEKNRSMVFLEEFKTIFIESNIEYFPLSEVIGLLVLENQANQVQLKAKLQKSLQINQVSVKIRNSLESSPQEVPELVKLFDKLTTSKS